MNGISEDTVLRCEDYLHIELIFLFSQKVQEMPTVPVQRALVCKDRQPLIAELLKLHFLEDIEAGKNARQKTHIRDSNYFGMLKLLAGNSNRLK